MRKPRGRNYRQHQLRSRDSLRYRYKPRHGVIVVCRGEAHQRRVYAQLVRLGHECKVVVV